MGAPYPAETALADLLDQSVPRRDKCSRPTRHGWMIIEIYPDPERMTAKLFLPQAAAENAVIPMFGLPGIAALEGPSPAVSPSRVLEGAGTAVRLAQGSGRIMES
jgi:hypothetical protein